MAIIEKSEKCRIIYHGGSQPGAARDIAPISISADGKLRARCMASNTVKTFMLEKIEICDSTPNDSEQSWSASAGKVQRFETLENLHRWSIDALVGSNWHVEVSPTHISLHRRFKNGKPLKGSDVSISYEEYTSDTVMTENGDFVEENVRKRLRPWTVHGRGKFATYGYLDRAAERFLAWASEHQPTKN